MRRGVILLNQRFVVDTRLDALVPRYGISTEQGVMGKEGDPGNRLGLSCWMSIWRTIGNGGL